ncbi:MAG TPA: glycosyltransferase, partial [Saprospiraceae bacterium]|nr:glycosyltransferase [Saprospiraceae bacterium]
QDIHFLGYISDTELTRLTGAALALTYVSLFEGFGVPILEAMHCHTPVITSNTSSMPEVAGDAALLVNPTDVAGIAAAMQQLYEDEALRNKLIFRGNLQKIQFSWRKATDVIWESMLELAGE